jgi:hypothetical protein
MLRAIRGAAINRISRALSGWMYSYRFDRFDAWFIVASPDDDIILAKFDGAATIARVVRSPYSEEIVGDESGTIPITTAANDRKQQQQYLPDRGNRPNSFV